MDAGEADGPRGGAIYTTIVGLTGGRQGGTAPSGLAMDANGDLFFGVGGQWSEDGPPWLLAGSNVTCTTTTPWSNVWPNDASNVTCKTTTWLLGGSNVMKVHLANRTNQTVTTTVLFTAPAKVNQMASVDQLTVDGAGSVYFTLATTFPQPSWHLPPGVYSKHFPVPPDHSFVYKWNAADGKVTVIAGNGTAGFSGDGDATQAQLNYPDGLAVDIGGTTLYISGTG
jgi:hypothetical protein